MPPSILCIARSSLDRTIGSELAEACLRVCRCGTSIVRFGLLWSVLPCERAENRYFTLRERWRAAQLAVAPDKTPDAAPGGRAASTLPRRMASRRLQMLNVNTSCIAASAAPLSRGAPECVLQVNV